MDSNFEDVGVMKDYSFDLAFGKDENDFECKVARNNHCCQGGFFLYIEGTEYGGIIDDIKVNTETDEVVYHGRTWHGFLDSKCILPLQPSDASTSDVTVRTATSAGTSLIHRYLIVSGEANRIIAWMLRRVGLLDLFSASSVDSGIYISNFKFDRYCMCYEGLTKMLQKNNGKLKLTFANGLVTLRAERAIDYSQDEQFDSDLISMTIKQYFAPTNHLICLGKGELEEREVLHLYTDSNGAISHTQSLTGISEVVEIYDDSNAESSEELEESGTSKLKEAWNMNAVETDFDSDAVSFDIGDIVGAVDNETGISGKAEIINKIVTISDNYINISYKVGD